MEEIQNIFQFFGDGAEEGLAALSSFAPHVTFVTRLLLPALAAVILLRCISGLLREKYEPEVWGYLSLPNGSRVALHHWENIIGRAKSADIVLNYPTISRNHSALIRDDDAKWKVVDLDAKGGVTVNGERIEGERHVKKGDVFGIGGVEIALLDLKIEEISLQNRERKKPGLFHWPSGTFFFLTLFQVLLLIQHLVAGRHPFTVQIPIGFLALTAIMWGYFLFVRALGRRGFEIEALAFFLSSIGLSVVASRDPGELVMVSATIAVGILFYFAVCWVLRDLRVAKQLRWAIAIGGILFLLAGFVLASYTHGARRWIDLGFITVQPSEFVKVAFIFAGAASVERLFARRNLYLFIAYSGACIGILALMNDFGSAAVFFAAFLVISFLRSGDFSTIALSLAGLVFAGFFALRIRPHVAARFAIWGNVWNDPFDGGMQFVRTMSSTASGGLFGLGAGRGTLSNVVAADTDMVFGVVAEELGLIIAIFCIVTVVIFAVYAIRASATARSSFTVIAAGAAVTMMLTQTILNVFGPLDVIPFTGITFPFVSRGGSSMIGTWGLLAFIKAADTRQDASIAIKRNHRAAKKALAGMPHETEHEEYEEYDAYEAELGYEDDMYETDYEPDIDIDGIDPYYFDDNWGEDT